MTRGILLFHFSPVNVFSRSSKKNFRVCIGPDGLVLKVLVSNNKKKTKQLNQKRIHLKNVHHRVRENKTPQLPMWSQVVYQALSWATIFNLNESLWNRYSSDSFPGYKWRSPSLEKSAWLNVSGSWILKQNLCKSKHCDFNHGWQFQDPLIPS